MHGHVLSKREGRNVRRIAKRSRQKVVRTVQRTEIVFERARSYPVDILVGELWIVAES